MRRSPVGLKPLLILVAIACREPVSAPTFFNPRLPTTDVWSGGALAVTADAFVPPARLPAVFLGDDTLPVRRVDDTTISAQLPTVTGTLTVRVARVRDTTPLGVVTLHGFRDVVQGPYLSGQVYQIQGGGPPRVIGAGNEGAAIVDLRFMTVSRAIPDSIHSPDCAMSVGPTYQANRFVFEGRDSTGVCSGPRVWSIDSSLHAVDSLASPGSWYVMAQPAPQRWFLDWNNNAYFWNCETGTCVSRWFGDPSDPTDVAISPRGDRFLWTEQCCTLSVFDAATLDTAFRNPTYRDVAGATFSPDGDTLYVIASDSGSHTHVAAVAADDGTVFHDLMVDSLSWDHVSQVYPTAIAPDPTRPWVYAAVLLHEDTLLVPTLLVLDRATWIPLGVLPAPGAAGAASLLWRFAAIAIVPSPLEHLVYVVGTNQGYRIHQSRAVVVRFETVP